MKASKNDPVTMFLKDAYVAPDVRIRATDVVAAVRRLAPPGERHLVTRSSVLGRLKAAGFCVGRSSGRLYVAGLDLAPRKWVVQVDGKMVLV